RVPRVVHQSFRQPRVRKWERLVQTGALRGSKWDGNAEGNPRRCERERDWVVRKTVARAAGSQRNYGLSSSAVHRLPHERCVKNHTYDDEDQPDYEPRPKIVVFLVRFLVGPRVHAEQTITGCDSSLITLPHLQK